MPEIISHKKSHQSKTWGATPSIFVIIFAVAIAFMAFFSFRVVVPQAQAAGATYYVDFASGSDTNLGTSTITAWKHAPGDPNAVGTPKSKILQSGDTVLFKGGVNYEGSIEIPSSGTEQNRITYKGDGWPGLEGVKAVMDGFGTFYRSIKIYGYLTSQKNYITVEGFKIQKSNGAPAFYSQYNKGIVFRNNEIADSIDEGGKSSAWIHIVDGENVLIENNYIHHSTGTRGIESGTKGIRIINNTIEAIDGTAISSGIFDIEIINNTVLSHSAGGHINGITTYGVNESLWGKNYLIAGNKVLNAIRPYTLQFVENVTVYNNIFKAGEQTPPIAVWNSIRDVRFLNNVLFSSYNPPITFYGTLSNFESGIVIKNNILSIPAIPGADISHNIYTVDDPYYTPHPTEIYEPDLTKIFVDPANNDYRLKQGSMAIDAGTDVTAYLPIGQFDYNFTKDITGTVRPQGAAWDIGAYESSGVIDTKPPTVPQNLTTQVISSSRIDLSWSASTDNVGVKGYKIYRNGSNIATTSTTVYSNTGLSPSTAYSYQVSAYDASGNESAQSTPVSATTHAVNTAPVLASIGNKAVNEGLLLSFTILATDANGDTLTYSATNLPLGAQFNSATRIFSWTPSYTQAGTYNVTFTVSDGKSTDSKQITITVNDVPQESSGSSGGGSSGNGGTPITDKNSSDSNESSAENNFLAEDSSGIALELAAEEVDSDSDGLTDAEELQLGTNPNNWDTDYDSYHDGEEVAAEYDPLSPLKITNIDRSLQNQLKGHILLQVERNGEAWYVNPKDGLRYYLRNGEIAYKIMRFLSLGITDADLAKIPIAGDNSSGDLKLVNRLKGYILLQVQQHGEAWYVNPKDGKRYYMKDGQTAYELMRFHSLGITNANLNRLPIGSLKDKIH